MKKKVIVTGANGFVGSLLCQQLVECGYHVAGLARKRIETHSFDIKYVQVNELDNLDSIKAIFNDCYAVIHLAAKVHVKNANHIAEYRHINTELTRYLAGLAASSGVKKFIYLSTIKVNGDITDSEPFNAKSVAQPTDAYAISKYEAEELLLKLHTSTEMDITIIRPVLMYGPGIKGNLLSLMKLVSKRLPLPFGSIENKRSLLNVRNLNSLIIECLENTNAAGKMFLAADGKDVSTTDIIRSISRAMKINIRLFSMPVSVIRLITHAVGKAGIYERLYGDLQVDVSETTKVLNWSPLYTFDEGIDEMVLEFLKKH